MEDWVFILTNQDLFIKNANHEIKKQTKILIRSCNHHKIP